jgi:ankyrin repeat protein
MDNPKLVQALVEAGADIDARDNKLWTPLMIAAMGGNYEVVRYLSN